LIPASYSAFFLEAEKSNLVEQILDAYHDLYFIISGITISEALYVATYEYYRQRGMIRGRYGLRKLIIKQGYPREVIDAIGSLLRDLNVEIVNEYFNYNEYLQIMQNFKLLPNDAQIALTCWHYSIDTILTFDEDFKRVSWLKVIP